MDRMADLSIQFIFFLGEGRFDVSRGPKVEIFAYRNLLTQVLFNQIKNIFEHTDSHWCYYRAKPTRQGRQIFVHPT